jgi:DNA polymerase III gamma/tau subunit
VENDFEMCKWPDHHFLRPLFVLVAYGPMALMGGKLNLGKNTFNPISITKLYSAMWHPSLKPDIDTISCQLDLWKVIVNMVRFGYVEFINGINTLMGRWKELPIFQHIDSNSDLQEHRLWKKGEWNSICNRMQKTPHFQVTKLIRTHVKGAKSVNSKTNADLGKSMLGQIVNIAESQASSHTESSQVEPSQTQPQTNPHQNERSQSESSQNEHPQNESPQDELLQTESPQTEATEPQDEILPQQNLDSVSEPISSTSQQEDADPQEDNDSQNTQPQQTDNVESEDPDTGKSSRGKRKRKNHEQNGLKDGSAPPKKRKKSTKTKKTSTQSAATNTTLSIYHKSLEVFSNSLYSLPVLGRSNPSVCILLISHCLDY